MIQNHSPAIETGVKQKRLGTIIFFIGIGFVIFSVISAYLLTPKYMKLGEGYWDTVGTTGIFFGYLWALSFPIAIILLVSGVLFQANAKITRIIVFMASCLVALFIIINVESSTSSQFFGIGGILIQLFFILTIWTWGNKRKNIEKEARIIDDLRILGYMFFALTSWFMCGLGATIAFATNPETTMLFTNSQETQANAVSILYKVMICFIVGWFFIFLSQWKAAREVNT